jgi:hypothetical protein
MGPEAVRARLAAVPRLSQPGARLAGRTTFVWGAWIFAATLVPTIFLSRYMFWDSYYDLYAGRYIAAHGVPQDEVMTIAAQGRDWVDQQWFAHLVYYQVWQGAGYAGVALVSSILIASGFGLLGALLIGRGLPPHRAVSWSFFAFVLCLGSTVIRAQSFSFPLFMLVLWLIVWDSSKTRFDWRLAALALPILVFWANVHGAVLIGTTLVAGFAVARAARHGYRRDYKSSSGYAALAVAAALCPFVTPYGTQILDYYTALIGNPVLKRFILEWSPQSLDNPFSYAFFAIVVLVVATVAYARGRGYRPPLVLLAPALALGALASQGIRYQVWFALAGTVLAADTLARVRPSAAPISRRAIQLGAGAVAVAVAGSLVILARTPDSQFESLTSEAGMAQAARYAAGHPEARVLADDKTSSALLWKYPALAGRVGLDARLEQYSRADLAAWFRYMTVSGESWDRITESYDVLVVSTKYHPELGRQLEADPSWRSIYRDDQTLIVARQNAETPT